MLRRKMIDLTKISLKGAPKGSKRAESGSGVELGSSPKRRLTGLEEPWVSQGPPKLAQILLHCGWVLSPPEGLH